MLSLEQILLYLPAVAIIIGIPGPDMLLSLSRGLSQGRAAGCAHACGAGVGIMGHSLLAALGVSALLTASETAFWIMKLVGAAYLIYLGVQQWRSGAGSIGLVPAKPASWWQIFMRGVLSNLLNPKVALFVLAFVPQFVRAGEGAGSPLVQMLLLGDWLEPLVRVGSSLVFRCVLVPDREALAQATITDLDDAALVAGLDEAARAYAAFDVAEGLALAAEVVRRNPGIRKPWELKKPAA